MPTQPSKYFIPTKTEHITTWIEHIWIKWVVHVNSGVTEYDQSNHCPMCVNFAPPDSVNFNEYIKHSFKPFSESFEEKKYKKTHKTRVQLATLIFLC